MLIFQCLAAAATTASAPATSAVTGDTGTIIGVILTAAFWSAWVIFAVLGLLKFRVFRAQPLRLAPPRTASFLLPTLLGTFAVYFLFATIAYTILYLAGVVSLPSAGPPKAAAQTASQPATTAASASQAGTAESHPAASPENAAQDIWLEICNGLGELAGVGLAIALFTVLFKDGLIGAGLSPRQFPRGIVLGVLAFLMLYPLLIGASFLLDGIFHIFHHVPKDQDVVESLRNARTPLAKAVGGIFAALVAPFAEETFFRGMLQTLLIQQPGRWMSFWKKWVGRPPGPRLEYRPSVGRRWAAILITAAFFGAVHLAPDQFPILFLLAVGLGYVYERTGNLFACMTIHFLFNLPTVIALCS